MERILSLLDQRNHYYEKFFALNDDELARLVQNKFEGLDNFYRTRDNILKIIKYIESEIAIAQTEVPQDYIPTTEEKTRIRSSLLDKKQYVNQIMQQDLQILECIDQMKSNIIRELQEIRKTKKAYAGYKGLGISRHLIEEA